MISRRDLLKTFGSLLAAVNLPSEWLDQPVAEEQEIAVPDDGFKMFVFKGKHSGRRKLEMPDGYAVTHMSFTGEGLTRFGMLGESGLVFQFAIGPSQFLNWVAAPGCWAYNCNAVQMQVDPGKEWSVAVFAKRI